MKPRVNPYLSCRLAVTVVTVCFAAAPCVKAGIIWDGGGVATTDINNASNWDGAGGGVVNALNGSTAAIFGTSGSLATINTNASFTGITINRDGNFEIANGSGSLTIGSDGITVTLPNTTTRTHTISESSVILGVSQTWAVTNNTGAAQLNVTGIVSGLTSGITKTGTGTLQLTGVNTFGGGLSVNEGTLLAQTSGSALGGTGSGVVNLGSTSAGTNNVTLALGTSSIFNNPITVRSGNSGTVTINNFAAYSPTLAAQITLNKGLILNNSDSSSPFTTLTVSGKITGVGGLTITGSNIASETILSNATNDYSGGTTVSSGRLTVGATGVLGSNVNTNNIGVSAGAYLTLAAATNAGANQTITLTSTASSLSVLGLGFNGLPNAAIAQADANGGVIAINGVTGYNTDLSTLMTGKNLFVGAIGTSTFTGAAGTIAAINSAYKLGGGGGSISFNTANLFTGANALVAGSTATNGGGTVIIGAAQDYSGGTTVAAGTLSVVSAVTLGSDINTNNIGVSPGAFLTLAAATNAGSNQTITLTSTASSLSVLGLGFNGLPNAAIAQANTNGGVIAINGVSGYSADLSTLLSGKNLLVGAIGTSTFTGAAGTIAAGNGSQYRVGGGGGSISFNTTNLFTGGNDLVVGSTATNGGGTVTLGAAQNYTGATTVNAGTFKLGHAGALGDGTNNTSSVTVAGNAVFDLNGISPTANVTLNLNSTASTADVGSLTNTAGGVSGGATATYGGAVNFGAATVVVGGGGNSGGNGSITLTGAITGNGKNLNKNGLGTLTLSNNGTVALGALQSNRGTVQVNSGTTLRVTTIDIATGANVGAGLTLNGGNVTSTGLSRFGNGTGSTVGTLTLNGGTLTVPALTKGPQNVDVIFNGGILKANTTSPSFLTGATSAKIQSGGATIDDGGYAITVGQALLQDTASTGGLTKNGSGSVTLSGANTYTGATAVTAGVLTVNGTGTISTSSGISISSGARFNYLPTTPGALTLPAASTLTLANGSAVGLNFGSSINVLGAASMPGNLNLSVSGSYTSGTLYTLLTAASGFSTTASNYNVVNPTNYTYALTLAAGSVKITPTTATALTNAYWKGGFSGGAGVWAYSNGSTASNWASATAGTDTPLTPGAAANVIFSATGAADQGSMTLGSDMAVNSILVNGTGATPNEINAITLANTGGYTLTIGSTVSPGITVNTGSGAVSLNSNIVVGNAQTWTNNSGGLLSVGGSGSIVSNGSNLLTIAGSGATTITNFNGGTGGLTVSATGNPTVTLAGTTVTIGAAQTWTNNSANALTVGNVSNGSDALTIAGTGNTLISGAIGGGSGGITKTGTGTLTLSGTNTYRGTTSVLGGLTINSGGSITGGGALTVGGGSAPTGTFQYDSAATSTFSDVRVGAGNDGTGNSILNQTAGTINANSLILNSDLTSLGAGDVYLSGGSMSIFGATIISNQTASDNILSTFTISGANTIFNASGELRLTGAPTSGRFANGKFVQSAGTVNVAGTNGLLLVQGISGNTAIRRGQYDLDGGTLNVNTITSTSTAAADAVATFNFNGGTLKPTASSTTFWVNNAQTTANVKDGGAKIDTDGKDITIAQPLVHFAGATTDSLTKSGLGTLTLTGTNTYTGITTVSAGSLIINGNQSTATGAVGVSNAGTRLMGTGTIGGATTINSAAIYSPGSATGAVGSQSFSSDLTYANGSIFEWDINNNSTASGFDTVAVTGNLNGSTGGDTSIFRVVFGTTAKAGINDSGNAFWNTANASQVWSMASLFGKNFTSGLFTSVQTYDSTGAFDVSSKGSFTINGSSLTWSAVPEPTSALAGLLITAGLLRRRRAA